MVFFAGIKAQYFLVIVFFFKWHTCALTIALRDDKGLARIHDLNSWQSTGFFGTQVIMFVCLCVLIYIYIYIYLIN